MSGFNLVAERLEKRIPLVNDEYSDVTFALHALKAKGEPQHRLVAFIPLTHSVFWGTLAYTLIGGTFGGTVIALLFLPSLYAIWFRIQR